MTRWFVFGGLCGIVSVLVAGYLYAAYHLARVLNP